MTDQEPATATELRDEMRQELRRLRGEIARLRAAMSEAADELDAYYRTEYGDHPANEKRLAHALASNPARKVG